MSIDAPKLINFYITHFRLNNIQLDKEQCIKKISTTRKSITGNIIQGYTSPKFLEPK